MRVNLPLFGNYEDSRIDFSDQQAVNVYPHSGGSFRQFPGLTEVIEDLVGTLSIADTTANSVSVPKTPSLKTDGAKVFFLSSTNILESTLSTPWDISTKGANTTTALGAYGGSNPIAGQIAADGDRYWILDGATDTLYEFTLTAWDSTTIAYASKSYDLSNVVDDPHGFAVNSTEDKVYVVGKTSLGVRKVWEFDMGADISTLDYKGAVKSISTSLSSSSLQIHLNANDSKFWVIGGSSYITEYVIAGSDVSFSVQLAGRSLSGITGTPYGCAFGDSGDRLYVFDGTNIREYDASGYPYGLQYKHMRGAAAMGGIIYAVYDQTLFSVDSLGNKTTIGTIDGYHRCVLETDGTQLVITTGSSGNKIYVYTTAGGLVTVTDADVTDSAKSSAYLDLRFWFDQPNGQFCNSAVDDATDFNALDFATAESFADDLLRVYAHNRYLYLFGENSIEAWYTSSGRPPASRQSVIERGIAGTYAVSSIDDQVYFLDQNRRPNVLAGLQYQPIFTPAIAEEWDTYETVSDCIVLAYNYRQQNFVDFVFPSASTTWTYHVPSGFWSERQHQATISGSNLTTNYRALDYINAHGRTYVVGNSYLYYFDETKYLHDTGAITRTLDTPTFTAASFGGVKGQRVVVNSAWLTVQSTDNAPTIGVSFQADSDTGKQVTRSTSYGVTVSKATVIPLLTPWGACMEGFFTVTTTDNAGIDFISLELDVDIRPA